MGLMALCWMADGFSKPVIHNNNCGDCCTVAQQYYCVEQGKSSKHTQNEQAASNKK